MRIRQATHINSEVFMNSKSRLWQYLSERGEATNAEIAEFFRGTRGQLSWGQRLREIRKELQAKGGDLTCRELRPGIYSYKVVYPEPPRLEQEQAIADNFHKQETEINFKATGKQLAWI
jgi:hypothetical protein